MRYFIAFIALLTTGCYDTYEDAPEPIPEKVTQISVVNQTASLELSVTIDGELQAETPVAGAVGLYEVATGEHTVMIEEPLTHALVLRETAVLNYGDRTAFTVTKAMVRPVLAISSSQTNGSCLIAFSPIDSEKLEVCPGETLYKEVEPGTYSLQVSNAETKALVKTLHDQNFEFGSLTFIRL